MLDRSAVIYCSTPSGLGKMETIVPILLLNPSRVLWNIFLLSLNTSELFKRNPVGIQQ
jgi:hypothetical protein